MTLTSHQYDLDTTLEQQQTQIWHQTPQRRGNRTRGCSHCFPPENYIPIIKKIIPILKIYV
jgi:hypothetical protein